MAIYYIDSAQSNDTMVSSDLIRGSQGKGWGIAEYSPILGISTVWNHTVPLYDAGAPFPPPLDIPISNGYTIRLTSEPRISGQTEPGAAGRWYTESYITLIGPEGEEYSSPAGLNYNQPISSGHFVDRDSFMVSHDVQIICTEPFDSAQFGLGIFVKFYITYKWGYVTDIPDFPHTYERNSFQSSTFIHSVSLLPFGGSTPIPPEGYQPYSEDGYSVAGGGGGSYLNDGENVGLSPMPSLSAVSSGFLTLYNPSNSQLNALASFMWSNPLFDISAWKKVFSDPMQAILGLSIIPVAPITGGSTTVKIGNISTDVSMPRVTNQYVEFDCGAVTLSPYWGSYLDCDPYTKLSIYLPYIGMRNLSADDIWSREAGAPRLSGRTLRVVYRIDVLTGACTAHVLSGGTTLYIYSGNVASSIPITGDNFSRIVQGGLQIAASAATVAIAASATGGAGGAAAGAAGAAQSAGAKTAMAATTAHALSTSASAITNMIKPDIARSGSISGSNGQLGIQKPYLVLTRPKQCLPRDKNKISGYPSMITATLGSITGYIELAGVHVEGVPGTDEEINEIELLLRNGVIL